MHRVGAVVSLKAMVMAAGKGTRLLPLTATRPKPMIPLLNEPIMDRMMENLKKAKIDEAVVLVDYLSDRIVNHLGDGSSHGMHITYTTDNIKRGTAGAVKYAAQSERDTFVVVSADVLTSLDIRKFIDTHLSGEAPVTMALSTVSDPTQFGVAVLDENGMITRFQEKPKREEAFSNLVNAGLYVCEPDILNLIPDNNKFDFSRDLFPLMLQKGMPIAGYQFRDYWNDVGLPSTYLQATSDLVEGRVEGNFLQVGSIDEVPHGRLITGRNCTIDGSLVIDGFAVLGDNVHIGKNIRISHSIIYSNCSISDGCVISQAILGEGVQLGSGVVLDEGVVVGDWSRVGEDSRIAHNIKIWHHSRIGPGTKMLHT
ncbi:MAG: NDP-sugar synthase [Methanomassiliicoccales archaeon]